MSPYGFAVLGLTAIVALLAAILVFAVMRFAAGARSARRGLRESSGETALLSSALQDAVTRLRAQEQAMTARAAASEQLSDQIVASLTSGLLVVDRTGRVQILNPAGRRLLGVDAGAHGNYRELLAGVPPLGDLIAECLTSPMPVVRRQLQIASPGRPSYLGVTISPLGDAADRRGLICLFSDLTAVVELEQQLRMKDALARLGEMTAGIAHEFRNGLATIHGYSRLLDPQVLPQAYATYVEGIRQEAEALGSVVTKFLNFARPEELAFTRIDLQQLAGRAAQDLRQEFPAAGVAVTGEFGHIQGDEVLLRQVFGNLLRNAVEACTAAGVAPVITIAGRHDPVGGTCWVTVSDNGPGIPEDVWPRVFQPFFTTRAQGTGLGLALVQKIVVLHNGRVSVGRSPAGGASIQMSFPAEP